MLPLPVFLFVVGLFFGSFLGVLVDRIPKGESVVKGRSKCEFCKHELEWYELIPVLSFLIQGGKCRNCGKKISSFYPTIEITTGVLFVLTYLFSISNFQFLISNEVSVAQFLNLTFYLFIVSSLIVVFFTDLQYGIIPDKIVFPAVLATLLYLFIIHNSLFIIHSLSAIGASFFLITISAIYYFFTKKESMGGGDIKFVFLMGLLLGFPAVVVSFYIAFLTGAGVSIILILWGRKKIRQTIPFGPFLVLGTFVSLFWGNLILGKALLILGLGS